MLFNIHIHIDALLVSELNLLLASLSLTRVFFPPNDLNYKKKLDHSYVLNAFVDSNK